MEEKDSYFIQLANKEGRKALERGDYPASCLVVSNGKIISKSSSKGVTLNDPTKHAEIIAISKASKKMKSRFLDNCILYSNIEPCLMCSKAIVYSKIKKVIYGSDHKEYGNKKSFDILKKNGIGKNIQVISGVGKEESETLLKKFLSSNKI